MADPGPAGADIAQPAHREAPVLTKLAVRNFKRFEDAEVELASPVVFVGPNNSGKTTALQALALWHAGLQRWTEKRGGQEAPSKRPGVTVNRRDLVAVPVPVAKLLWRDLHVREVRKDNGRQRTSNVLVQIVVEGVSTGRAWTCGLEFDYANEESFYCRPLRTGEGKNPDRIPIPNEAADVHVAYLPPMSGLAATEVRLDPGAVEVRIGEGRTAEVLRNLCHRLHQESPERWNDLARRVEDMFGARIEPPRYVAQRGEIAMSYREQIGTTLDLSASGRGLQQTLLLLAYMYANSGTVLLLDEPDAHLEILRQRQTYGVLTEVAEDTGSQIVAATHSEVVLNEAAGRDLVVAFVGSPHRMGGSRGGSQVAKALKEIGFEDYYQAEQTGWVLYLEGSTDLAILQAFARRLNHDGALCALERPFVRYVGNHVSGVQKHFQGLREAVPQLRGIALFDRLGGTAPKPAAPLECMEWQQREIENYLCTQTTLEAFAANEAGQDILGPLSQATKATRHVIAMREAIAEMEAALRTLGKGSPWDADTKASDDFLVPLFASYYDKLNLPNAMAKRNFHVLAKRVPEDEIAPEVKEKLDAVARVAEPAST